MSQQPLEESDNWEGSFYDVKEQRTVKLQAKITYTDAAGLATERIVDITAYEPNNPSGLVTGHCHLRGSRRTFRLDRIRKAVDTQTGEILQSLQDCLDTEWKTSPDRSLDVIFNQHLPALKLLLYVAKADGAMRAPELEVITKHCIQLTNDNRITTEHMKAMLQNMGQMSITSFQRTYNALRREAPEAAAKAADACRAIVATQREIHPNEQSALDLLDKPLPTKQKTT